MSRRLLLGSWQCMLTVLLFAALAASAAVTATGAVQAKRSVLSGVYTEEQAKRGEAAYRRSCAGCHLDDMYGDGFAVPLAGSEFYFRFDGLPVADLMGSRMSMPMDGERLSPDVYADIIAYLLQFNKLPAGGVELPTDTGELEQIMIERPAQ